MTDLDCKFKQTRLTEGPVGKILLDLAVPMTWGLLAMFAFNLADTFFVSRLGTDEIAALSYTFPVVISIIYITLGLSTGTSSLIAREIGKGNYSQVRRNATDALVLAGLVVLFFQIVGLLTIEPLFSMLGAQKELIPLIKDYMEIWYIGVIFLVFPIIGNGAIRGSGDTKLPSIIMTTAALVNFVLDPIFIFGFGFIPAFGIKGAAIATLIARACSFLVSMYVLIHKKNLIKFCIPKFSNMLDSWKKILHVGIPTAATNVVIPFSTGIIILFLSEFGKEAVAAFGIVSRLETFLLIAVIAFSVSMGPFVGQNWEAGKRDRVCKAIRFGFKFSFMWGGFIALILMFFAPYIIAVFNDNPEIINYGKIYLYIISVTYLFEGIRLSTSSVYNALGKPLQASSVVLVRMFGLYIPLAFVGSKIMGVPGIFLGAAIANLFSGYMSFKLSNRLCIANKSTS